MGHDVLMMGVDAGGTSTRAVLTTAAGECIGYGLGGRGNPISAGPDRAADGVLQAVSQALGSAGGIRLSRVSAITVSMAGQPVPADAADAEWLRARLEGEGFSGTLTFDSDLLATYFSGTVEPFGYAVVSGTGASVIRVSDARIDAIVDGLGWMLGDRGSGFWIGHRAAKSVVRDLDGAGPATAMTPRLLSHLGIGADGVRAHGRPRALEQVVKSLYALPPIELAALAPLAFDAAGSDPVAESILRRAGSRLASSLTAVLTEPGPLVLGGGVLSRESLVRVAFIEHLGDAVADLEVIRVSDGAIGAGLLALRAGGARVSVETLGTLSRTVGRFRVGNDGL